MIEELIRKIEHYHEFKMLQERNRFYREYIEYLYKDIELSIEPLQINFPIVIKTNYQRAVDKIVLRLNQISKNTFTLISLEDENLERESSRKT